MNRLKKWSTLYWPIIILLVISLLLLTERSGLIYGISKPTTNYLDSDFIQTSKMAKHRNKECMVFYNSADKSGNIFFDHITFVLDSMSVGYDTLDIAKNPLPDLTAYRTVVVATPNLDPFGDSIFTLTEWVKQGGGCMFLATLDQTVVYRSISDKLGIVDGGNQYSTVIGLVVKNGLMIDKGEFEFQWDEPASSVINANLDSNCSVYVTSNDSSKAPMLWKRDYGKGRFVINNHGMCEKTMRGLTASAYSLLEENFAYPVINSSVFFLDDFPSPVPMGDDKYIQKYYQRDISSFYVNIWFNDILSMSDKYNIKFTGVVIEDYTDETTGPYAANLETERFRYFGGLLLEKGGEIGLHGYNHIPLCLDGFDFEGKVDYNTWSSVNEMADSFKELYHFTDKLFPRNQISTYVAPSNILSKEGRRMIVEHFPEIKTIAGLYVVDSYELEQEFRVADDGIIELPRVISGTQIDSYTRWAAFNELSFHYVNTHFMHPDDTLDVDRGADKGWHAMKQELEGYLDWLYGSAPNLRNQTASEASMAIERYDCLTVDRSTVDSKYRLEIQGFHNEAYFIVRLNQGYEEVTGGTLEKLNGNLYVLRATAPHVEIQLGE